MESGNFTSEFRKYFADFFEEKKEKRRIVIAKLNEIGDWAAFVCVVRNDKEYYGGHYCICNCAGQSKISMSTMLKWLSELQKDDIEIIVDENRFLNIERVKSQ